MNLKTGTPHLKLFLVFLALLIITCKEKKEDPQPLPPSISGFTPGSAFTGQTVTITGSNFSNVVAENVVKFNDVAATINSATTTQLLAVVPATATTGPITVSTNGLVATSSSNFTVLHTSFTGFSPTSGIVGTTVTITGENFDASPAANVVTFNGTAASVSAATTTALTVTVPEGAATGKVTVVSGNRTVTSSSDFTVLQTTITGFSPAASTVKEKVTITGTNFSTTPALNVVKFGDVPATVTSATATELEVTVPDDAVTGKISVTIYEKATVSTNDFTVLLPVIDNFSPLSAVAGVVVTINGSNFSAVPEDNIVRVGSTEVVAKVLSTAVDKLTIEIPEDAYNGKISVTSKGKKTTSSGDFTLPTISIQNFDPVSGLPSHEVTITSDNVSPVPDFNKVTFDGVSAEVVSVSPGSVTVKVPEEMAGKSDNVNTILTIGHANYVGGTLYPICDTKAELIFSNIEITNVAADKKSFNYSFTITNIGGATADMSDVRFVGRARKTESSDGIPTSEMLLVTDEMLTDGGMLESGQAHTFDRSADIDPSVVTEYQYLGLVMVYVVNNVIMECNLAADTNVSTKKIEN